MSMHAYTESSSDDFCFWPRLCLFALCLFFGVFLDVFLLFFFALFCFCSRYNENQCSYLLLFHCSRAVVLAVYRIIMQIEVRNNIYDTNGGDYYLDDAV